MSNQVFDRNDFTYLKWIVQNRSGFVINTPRTPDPNYLLLYRATCYSISKYSGNAEKGGFTERQYIKVCSTDIKDLRDWVRQNGRPDSAFSSKCQHCDPLYSWENKDNDWFN